MIDAQLPLQAAIVAAIKADTALSAIIGGRVFDRVPTNTQGQIAAEYPFVAFGSADSDDESTACHRLVDCNVDLNALSREVGYVEAKRIGARLGVILDAALTVEGFVVKHRRVRLTYQREADGLTSRAIARARYRLEAVA